LATKPSTLDPVLVSREPPVPKLTVPANAPATTTAPLGSAAMADTGLLVTPSPKALDQRCEPFVSSLATKIS
jgi:hypothetical protein